MDLVSASSWERDCAEKPVAAASPARDALKNRDRLDVRALLRLVCDTAALRRVRSATVLKASRSSPRRINLLWGDDYPGHPDGPDRSDLEGMVGILREQPPHRNQWPGRRVETRLASIVAPTGATTRMRVE